MPVARRRGSNSVNGLMPGLEVAAEAERELARPLGRRPEPADRPPRPRPRRPRDRSTRGRAEPASARPAVKSVARRPRRPASSAVAKSASVAYSTCSGPAAPAGARQRRARRHLERRRAVLHRRPATVRHRAAPSASDGRQREAAQERPAGQRPPPLRAWPCGRSAWRRSCRRAAPARRSRASRTGRRPRGVPLVTHSTTADRDGRSGASRPSGRRGSARTCR